MPVNCKIKNLGARRHNFKKYVKYVLIGLISGAANGLFGAGGGTIAVPGMAILLGMDEHKAHATAISIILPLTVVSAAYYVLNGCVNWSITYGIVLGGLVGGYAGAKLLDIVPANILRKIFGIFMVLAALRMMSGR